MKPNDENESKLDILLPDFLNQIINVVGNVLKREKLFF